MSRIVMVHGIGQEQESADTLEARWIPALAGGVRTAGHSRLADRLWRDARPGEEVCRMAFYGDLFLSPGRMGTGQEVADLGPAQRQVAELLAIEWLRRAEVRAGSLADRAEAHRQLLAARGPAGRQGLPAAARPALNGLSRIRWFAPSGMAFAQRFANRALAQVTRYLTEDDLREAVLNRVAAHIDADTVAVIGHSLGSVAAFQAAHRLRQRLPLLLTLGSPLGLRTVVYDRLPEARAVPAYVDRWVNLADRDDLVAAVPDLTSLFADPFEALESDWTLDNGSHPHRAESYLTKPQTGKVLARVLAPTP